MKDVDVPKGYKSTDVGVIPEDWEVEKLSSVSNVKTGPFGSALHEKDYVEDGIPIITVEHLGEPRVVHHDLPMVSDFDKQRLKAYELKIDDIVFSRVGSVDRNSLITNKENGWLFSSRLLRIRPNKQQIFSTFLSYFFHHEPSKQRIRRVAVGQTMPSLNTQILNEILIPLPPLPEQKTIARVLSDVDELIRKCDSLLAKKRDIKQGTMQQLLTGKKRLPGFSGKWEEKKLGDIINKIVGGGTPRREKKEYWNGNIFWVTVKDFSSFDSYSSEETITKEGLNSSSSNLIPKRTIIISTRMAVGKAVLYQVDVAINQDLKAIFQIFDVNTEFLLYWFKYNASDIEKTASGSTVKGISISELKNIDFNYFCLKEQKAIAEILNNMDAEIEALEKKRDKYKAIKQGMMQELLTGKTRIIG